MNGCIYVLNGRHVTRIGQPHYYSVVSIIVCARRPNCLYHNVLTPRRSCGHIPKDLARRPLWVCGSTIDDGAMSLFALCGAGSRQVLSQHCWCISVLDDHFRSDEEGPKQRWLVWQAMAVSLATTIVARPVFVEFL